MKQYAFLFALMNIPVIAMNITTKLYCNKQYPRFLVMHIFNKAYYFNKTYYAKCGHEFNTQSTFLLRDLRIANEQSKKQIATLKKFILYDLQDENLVKESLWRDEQIKMLEESIEHNEDTIRRYLNEFCNPLKKFTVHE